MREEEKLTEDTAATAEKGEEEGGHGEPAEGADTITASVALPQVSFFYYSCCRH